LQGAGEGGGQSIWPVTGEGGVYRQHGLDERMAWIDGANSHQCLGDHAERLQRPLGIQQVQPNLLVDLGVEVILDR
jgi:hypothetical protein